MNLLRFLPAWLLVGSLFGADIDTRRLPLPVPRKVDFAKEVWPILKENCISCHGPEKQKGKYRVDSRAAVLKEGKNGSNVIAGNSEKSPLIHMVSGLVDEGLMPPPSDKPGEESKHLTREEIGILRAWIDQGAAWPDGPIVEEQKQLAFATDIAPILQKACADCHGAAQPKGDFRIESRESVLKGGKSYGAAVKPGDAKSPLITIVSGQDEDLPEPGRHKLPARQVEIVRQWIAQGAK